MEKATNTDFDNYKEQSLTKPRDLAWDNWAKFVKVGDKVQGYIRDAFYRAEEQKGMVNYKEQRGITLEQPDGKFVNVGIKRLSFILNKTDDMHVGDPLTIELIELKPNEGADPTKILGFFGTSRVENASNPTVKELDDKDQAIGGTVAPEVDPTDEEAF